MGTPKRMPIRIGDGRQFDGGGEAVGEVIDDRLVREVNAEVAVRELRHIVPVLLVEWAIEAHLLEDTIVDVHRRSVADDG
jgi:hypothetical protein